MSFRQSSDILNTGKGWAELLNWLANKYPEMVQTSGMRVEFLSWNLLCTLFSSGRRCLCVRILRISLTRKRVYGLSDFQVKRSFVKAFQNLSEDKVSRNAPDWVWTSRGVGQDVNRKIYTLLPSLPLVLNSCAWRIFSRENPLEVTHHSL